MYQKTLAELSHSLAKGDCSSVELTKFLLERIKRFNPQLNVFITLNEEQALITAKEADQRITNGTATALTGIPIAHKDIFCTKNLLTTCGSKMLHNFIPPYESSVTQRCLEAGMVPVGKTNMDEFAMGSSNESSHFGPCRNPWNLGCVPGGSSGGSAAAVAGRLVPVATGSDTGGSIRQPASFCGITGLKPTYGRVSRWGMIAYASSLDQAGPMAQTCEDAAMLLNTIAGYDIKDSTSADKAVTDYTQSLNDSIAGLKIGLPKEIFAHSLDSNIESLIQGAIKELEKLGAIFSEVELPTLSSAISAYYIIAPAECSSNLSRFDGVRFGYRCEAPKDLLDLYKRSRSEGFGDEVKRRIMMGTYALSSGYYDAYYLKAQKIRRLIKDDFEKVLQSVDVILSPTTPSSAFELGAIPDPVAMYQEDIFTIPANLAGLPALSIPVGFTENLPVGLQLIGNYFDEARLLNIGHLYQTSNPWHQELSELVT